jgi:Domain of unknown function DUF29
MTANLPTAQTTLYTADYVRWIETNLEHLKAKEFSLVDWENLVEEIEDMSNRERRSLESNLVIVLLHLLKWHYQPNLRSGSWKGSLVEHRRRIRKALKGSPSLMPYLRECFGEAYADAVEQAIAETNLLDVFPPQCSYSLEQVLDAGFLPE